MNMSKSRDIQAKMPSPKVIYASNESKSVLARNLEECRDNDKNSQSVVYCLNAFWFVTVKVLNSYEKCIFTPDPGFGYLPGWELSGGVFRRCRVDTG